MEILIVTASLLIMDLLALKYGADSREDLRADPRNLGLLR